MKEKKYYIDGKRATASEFKQFLAKQDWQTLSVRTTPPKESNTPTGQGMDYKTYQNAKRKLDDYLGRIKSKV